ncbi:TIGR04282 family arsenosugar biosynthesis glycosyltransferase [Amycolatopsis kentuckyensis]|uniref:TIGR04282 family arsenosugar biosynthesis glycosyltransferase n=1 Tax=Amycolatopsis kentuckyensis TaxID=218823 RepID=UPI003565BE9F
MTAKFVLLVVAKAPVPGLAKTRLSPPATPAQAARIAAAALLDTLDAVCAVPGAAPVVAMTGDLGAAALAPEIGAALRHVTTIPQRGWDFGARLAHAHADAAAVHSGLPILQIGMDTPQVTPASLAEAAAPVVDGGHDSVLGPAVDGGWWALGLAEPRHAQVLAGVPMSREDTGERTMRALTACGLRPRRAAELSDVDTMTDARTVAAMCPDGRFARAVAAVRGQAVA